MNNIFKKIIISSPNESGGLFYVDEKTFYKIDARSCAGIYCEPNRLIIGIQPKSIYISEKNSADCLLSSQDFNDIHDVFFHQGSAYVAITSTNEVLKLTIRGEIIERWTLLGETDSHHLNSITLWNDRLVFSAFGDFKTHREYKGKTSEAGYVKDLLTGRTLIGGLSEPHSLTPHEGKLYLANSRERQVLVFSSAGLLIQKIQLEGYTRGILISEGKIYVGLSKSRNLEEPSIDCATVVALNLETLEEVGRLKLPASEVYDITQILDENLLAHAISGVSQNSIESLIKSLRDSTDALDVNHKTISRLTSESRQLHDELAIATQQLLEKKQELAQSSLEIDRLNVNFEKVLSSRSWQLTRPLRVAGRLLRGEFHSVAKKVSSTSVRRTLEHLQLCVNAMGYIRHGQFLNLYRRIKFRRQIEISKKLKSNLISENLKQSWCILTTEHTLYVAHLLRDRLIHHGFPVEIETESEGFFPHDFYIVICPQAFPSLPPGEKRISFQMEQSTSDRWFTKKYLDILEKSLAVIDYSLKNIEFLGKNSISFPLVHYLPIGSSLNYGGQKSQDDTKTFDVLFYGDANGPARRRKMLTALGAEFRVKIISEVYGEELLALIRKSRLVVNIHYYDDALLEMPRIQECLSLGIPVVSEDCKDRMDYPELGMAVRFFEEDSIPDMLRVVRDTINNPISKEEIDAAVTNGAQRFSFMFDRFMISMGFLASERAPEIDLPISMLSKRVVLSLPETFDRRNTFELSRPLNCAIFEGIRFSPGWIGCGLSYKTLAKNALDKGLSQIMVMEDDAILPEDFEETLPKVQEYLSMHAGEWDVFAGLIASLKPSTKVISASNYEGIQFLTIDTMTSTVFNIYSTRALEILSRWDQNHVDPRNNTIDRFMESQESLRVVVTLPFFAGHREEVHSTLWGFKNDTYNSWINRSEEELSKKLLTFLNKTSEVTP